MTNIFSSERKVILKDRLFKMGVKHLEQEGWKVERVKMGKSSVRQIRKGDQTQLASIRTSQDQWLSNAREKDDSAWSTLENVDVVVIVSVNDRENPTKGLVHGIPQSAVKDSLDRAYKARLKAGYVIRVGRGVFVLIYHKDLQSPVTHVGGGLGRTYPPVAEFPVGPLPIDVKEAQGVSGLPPTQDGSEEHDEEKPLTIPEAKRRLAITFGCDPANIKIIVES